MSNSFSFTPQQEAAIKTKDGPILVSAGAGSGKTRVLVQRLLRMLEEGGDITEYLVITYTKAAAAELKTRILDGINKLLAQNPTNGALRKQSHLIHKANIGTIHSFCINIIRENVHLLGISPELRVVEENEARVIKDAVLERIIDERYEHIREDSDFCALVDATSAGRDDTKLVDIIKETYEKLQSHPYPETWMDSQLKSLAAMDQSADASQTVWGRIVLDRAIKTAKYWQKRISDLLSEECPDFIKAYGDSLNATLYSIAQFVDAAGKSWDDAVEKAAISFPRATNVKGYDEYKELRKRCKKEMDKLTKEFTASSQELMRGMENIKPVISGLFSVVSEFSRRYSEEKRSRGLIDFSDQEHMAVSLLTRRDTLEPTDLAVSLSRRFKEIMVDEYQDVNAVQELLFKAVSRNGKNIFMVGDVKQSIYRFRLADPSIFMEKYDKFKLDPKDGDGRKILLTKNFRSKKAVLDCVNFVFSNIMSTEFGEMSYTEDEYLEWGGTIDAPDNEAAIELDVLDSNSDDEIADKDDLEAEFVAKRVRELSVNRKYSDIAILLRSVKDKSWRYAAALTKAGIPVYSEGSDGFYKTFEITIMLSLLSVIDNPRQDVPLISVLRSPIYGFSADDLAEVRLADRDGDFYTALVKSAEQMEKASAFLSELEYFRDTASEVSTDKLIWHIYDKTGFLAIAAAMTEGDKRVENLMCLFEYAKSYESTGYKGLFSFISYIRKQIDSGNEPQRERAGNSNTVRIMSIHKSKGLEFPVVILAGLAKRFNVSDSNKPMLIHPKLGAGPKLIEPEERIEYETLARRAVATVLREETMAEEMRILYVAMTRAQEKLIMTCAFGDCEKSIRKLMADAALPVEPQVLASATSMANWILLTALCRSEAGEIRYGGMVVPYEDGQKWDIRLITADDVKNKPDSLGKAEKSYTDTAFDTLETPANIRKKLDWQYPYKVAEIPSKLTATELKGRFYDVEAAEDAEHLDNDKLPIVIRQPDFVSPEDRVLTGAERGTALHLAMQYIDYKKCDSIENIKNELNRIEALGLLDSNQKQAISPWKILNFFRSDLGKRIIHAEKLYREFKFSLLVPAETWFCNDAGDEILLQGVIDCCIVEDGQLTIIDYKTDYVDENTISKKAEMYKNQLSAYKLAMEKITGLTVKETVLYFFSMGLDVKIEIGI